ncbi:MAG: hypothetical protein M3Q42_13470 [Pseudomonadota bacterium]|nr:hypothetical protein [Pseudomonadota bacterium]
MRHRRRVALLLVLAAATASCERTRPIAQPAAALSADVAGVNAEPGRAGVGIVPVTARPAGPSPVAFPKLAVIEAAT